MSIASKWHAPKSFFFFLSLFLMLIICYECNIKLTTTTNYMNIYLFLILKLLILKSFKMNVLCMLLLLPCIDDWIKTSYGYFYIDCVHSTLTGTWCIYKSIFFLFFIWITRGVVFILWINLVSIISGLGLNNKDSIKIVLIIVQKWFCHLMLVWKNGHG